MILFFPLQEALSPGKEFWESSKTLKTLLEEKYFREEGQEFQWPETLKKMMSDSKLNKIIRGCTVESA
jgi:DNA mismatch repair protein MSH6